MKVIVLYSDAFEIHRNHEKRVKKWIDYFIRPISDINKKILLDCGCGVGRFTVPLSALFFKTFGVDKDISMLETAQKKDSCVHWIQADVSEIPLSDSTVDVILASMLIEHLGSLDKFLSEAARLIKKGGVLLIRTMLPGDIDNTTWYAFSEKARAIEMDRTYDLESLLKSFSEYGFGLSQECSVFHVLENFSNSNMVDRLTSKCYEVLHRLDENEHEALISKAKEWERTGTGEEVMSSSLLVFTKE